MRIRLVVIIAAFVGITRLFGGEFAASPPSFPQEKVFVPSKPIIGAIRWDAWHKPRTTAENGGGGGPVVAMMESLGPKPYHYRLPFFATILNENQVRIDGYTQQIMDQEIDFAKAGGLDYWAFLLYEEGTAMSDGLRYYLSSAKKREMNFCAITSPDSFGSAQQFHEKMKRLIKLIGDPSYQMVLGNRPLVYLFNVEDNWLKAWGGEKIARRLFDEFRDAVKAARRGNPYLVVMDFSPSHGKKIMSMIGGDAISSYATAGAVSKPSPFCELARHAATFWEQCHGTGAEVVPLAMTGWDRRPRIEHPVPWEKYQKPGEGVEKFYVMPTPQELAEHIGEAMNWTLDNKAVCPAQTVIIYAWNEHDEGGFLCPTLNENGTANTARLDAISAMKSAFRTMPPSRATRKIGKETADPAPHRAI